MASKPQETLDNRGQMAAGNKLRDNTTSLDFYNLMTHVNLQMFGSTTCLRIKLSWKVCVTSARPDQLSALSLSLSLLHTWRYSITQRHNYIKNSSPALEVPNRPGDLAKVKFSALL